jgi:UDP-4-amino-4,6-dideoxy-N-acetyl-beta-L-altrosamine N-acetyltransferase
MSDTKAGLIRHMEESDIEQVLSWRNHPDIRRYMYTQHEISLAEHTRWFNNASMDTARQLLIFESDGVAQGFVNLHEFAAGGIANWGFYVAPDAPKGTGRHLGQCLLRHAFRVLSLHKLCGQALGFNERSIQFHLHLAYLFPCKCFLSAPLTIGTKIQV